MYSGDKPPLCRRKIFIICLFLVLFFSCLFSSFFTTPANAVAAPIQSFSVSALPPNGSAYSLINNIYYNSLISFDGVPPYAVKLYRFDTDNVTVTGNVANLSFETNLVFSQPQQSTWIANFVNKDYISVLRCSMDSTPLTIQSSRVSYRTTEWSGTAPAGSVFSGRNKTLTVYGNVVLNGLTTGSHTISCTVGSDDFAFYQVLGGAVVPNFYIEQQPTSVVFTTSESDALSKQQIQSIDHVSSSIESLNESVEELQERLDNVSSSVDSINDGEQQRYDDEIEREEAKEAELNDAVDDLSLSTPVTPNPYTGLFLNFDSGCYDTRFIHNLFSTSSFHICSPYPSLLRQILNFVSSLFLSGLLVRLYYKKLKGGMNG